MELKITYADILKSHENIAKRSVSRDIYDCHFTIEGPKFLTARFHSWLITQSNIHNIRIEKNWEIYRLIFPNTVSWRICYTTDKVTKEECDRIMYYLKKVWLSFGYQVAF